MVMPALPNLIFTILNFSILFIVACFLLRSCFRQGTPQPLLFLIGGMISYVTEPFFDLMVCAWYPEIGTDSFLRAFNVSVPTWVIAPWGFYIGGQAYWVFRKFTEGMTASTLWKLFPIFWFTNVAFEIPGLQLGVYTYYGPQAFKVFGFPLWMGMANATMPIVIAAVAYALRDFLSGPRVWLTVPLVPMAGLAAGAGVGWPMWFALNSGMTETGTMLATIPVFGFACLVLLIITHTICIPTAASTGQTAQMRPQNS
jgi:hypothetical protein